MSEELKPLRNLVAEWRSRAAEPNQAFGSSTGIGLSRASDELSAQLDLWDAALAKHDTLWYAGKISQQILGQREK